MQENAVLTVAHCRSPRGMPDLINEYWNKKVPRDKQHERFLPGSKKALKAKQAPSDSKSSPASKPASTARASLSKEKPASSSKPASKPVSKKRSNDQIEPSKSASAAGETAQGRDKYAKKKKVDDSPKLVAVQRPLVPVETDSAAEDEEEDSEAEVDGYLLARDLSEHDKKYKNVSSWEVSRS